MSDTQIQKVDILISGKNYTIHSPINEIEAVQSAAEEINQFLNDIRKKNPNATLDQMLVLYCLAAFEEKEKLKTFVGKEQEAKALLDSMIADTKALIH